MTMNEDIAKYGVYGLTHHGELVKVPIYSTDDYNHYTHHLHHYVKQQCYEGNKKWYQKRGIEQKLILLPIFVHEQLHFTAIKNLTDEEFKDTFKISRWDMLFNRQHTNY